MMRDIQTYKSKTHDMGPHPGSQMNMQTILKKDSNRVVGSFPNWVPEAVFDPMLRFPSFVVPSRTHFFKPTPHSWDSMTCLSQLTNMFHLFVLVLEKPPTGRPTGLWPFDFFRFQTMGGESPIPGAGFQARSRLGGGRLVSEKPKGGLDVLRTFHFHH